MTPLLRVSCPSWRVAAALLALLLPLAAEAFSFVSPHTVLKHHGAIPDNPMALQSSKSSSRDTSGAVEVDRRELLVAGGSIGLALLGGAAATIGGNAVAPPALSVANSNNNAQILASSDDALALIDAQGDRRFIHAVIASDYRLLYRGGNLQKRPSVYSIEFDSDRMATPLASDFKNALEQQQQSDMASTWSSNSPFHMAVTNPNMIDSKVVSVWPLGENVHFAWTSPQQQPDVLNSNSKLIVDGVDCGVMSLEDALERPDGQVMMHANSFLMVPASMEKDLVEKLKHSFII